MAKPIKEEDCPQCEESNEGWIFTYADMITLLFCFFVILYSMCPTDAAKVKEFTESLTIIGSYSPNLLKGQDSVVEQLANQLEESELADDTHVNVEERGVVISFNFSTLFEPESVELTASAQQELAKFSKLVYVLPNKIEVQAYTDDTLPKRWASNWELSGARAAEIANYLVAEGVDGKRIRAKAFGSTHPRVPNDSPQHRAFNNRVEVILLMPGQP